MKKITVLFVACFTFLASAQVKIKKLDLQRTNGGEDKIIVNYEGAVTDNPVLTVNDKIVTIEVAAATVWPKIDRKFSILANSDTQLMAYPFESGKVRVRAVLPMSLKGKEDLVNIGLKDGALEINIPKLPPKVKLTEKAPSPVVEDKKVSQFDEQYLAQLEKQASQLAKETTKEVTKETAATQATPNQATKLTDGVTLSQASTKEVAEKTQSNSFSVAPYVGKFVAFLSLIVLFFYGVLALIRKGVIKKSSLSFLNNSKMIEVLNSTHIGPKRQLMMIKAHNQVFLIASSENGVNLISEMSDVTGLLKSTEVSVTGTNFDTSLTTANKKNKNFKLKEVQTTNSISTDEYGSLDELLNEAEEKSQDSSKAAEKLAEMVEQNVVKDTVKLSDQIKSKVKGLKPLQ